MEIEDVLMKPKVLVSCPIAQLATEKLGKLAEVNLNPDPKPFTKEQLKKEVAHVDAIILGADKFDEQLMAATPP